MPCPQCQKRSVDPNSRRHVCWVDEELHNKSNQRHHRNRRSNSAANDDDDYYYDDDAASPSTSPFRDIDPTEGNEEAAAEILRIENGDIAREVTDRLCKIDRAERERKLELLKAEHAIKKRVPIRTSQETNQYVHNMLVKGEAKRQQRLRKVEAEMYPKPVPRILSKSRELAKQQKLRTGDAERVQDRYQKLSPSRNHQQQQHNNNSNTSTTEHWQNRIPLAAQNNNSSSRGVGGSSGGVRSQSPGFKPCGPVPHSSDLFLTSAPSPRCPSPSHHGIYAHIHRPLSEIERAQRFTELSQPRASQQQSQQQQHQHNVNHHNNWD